MNYKIVVQYDGSRYKGWQVQNSTDLTIQGKLQQILEKFAGEPVEVIGSGRTDAGVHAIGQVANFHLNENVIKRFFVSESKDEGLSPEEKREAARRAALAKKLAEKKAGDEGKLKNAQKVTPKDIMRYLNRHLPEDIAVISIERVDERFHSRYNAVSKHYRYRIHVSDQSNVFERKFVYYYTNHDLDAEKMKEAAKLMVGRKDFKSFCGNNKMKKSTVRTVTDIQITTGNGEIVIDYFGDGFLQNMIRIMTGTLIEVGNGTKQVGDIPGILESLDRANAGYTAPPQGLCLMEVFYD